MIYLKKILGVLLLVLLIGSAYWIWSALQTEPEQNAAFQEQEIAGVTKINDENNVVAAISLLKNDKGSNGKISFQVKLDTHMVPLSEYDVSNSITVKSSTGEAHSGFTWEVGRNLDHHRSGILTLVNNSIINPETKWLKVQLKNLAGVPVRQFEWDEKELRQ